MVQASTDTNGTLSLKWVRPSSQPPDTSRLEQEAFNFFRVHMVKGLPGTYEPSLWTRHVLPVSVTETAVRHAVIALGALGRQRVGAPMTESNHFALQHYSKAMKALHTKIEEQGKLPSELILISCLLLVTFEFQQFGFKQAKSHLDSGLSIIREMQDNPGSAKASSKATMDLLTTAFERLDIQMSLFTSTRVTLNRAVGLAQAPRLPAGMSFDTVTDASRPLSVLLAAMRELVLRVEEDRFSPGGIASDNYTQYEYEQMKQLVSLSRWENAMQGLMPRLTSAKDQQTARILQLQQICATLMVSMVLADGREMLWDGFMAYFQRILDLARAAFDHNISCSETEDPSFSGFSVEMGFIPPLYFVVLKCRDPKIRHAALDLLKTCKHQEGVWNGPFTSALAEGLIYLEEQGQVIEEASDLPESRRLYQAYYDTTISRSVVHCKRRCFEEDSRWLDYCQSVVPP